MTNQKLKNYKDILNITKPKHAYTSWGLCCAMYNYGMSCVAVKSSLEKESRTSACTFEKEKIVMFQCSLRGSHTSKLVQDDAYEEKYR